MDKEKVAKESVALALEITKTFEGHGPTVVGAALAKVMAEFFGVFVEKFGCDAVKAWEAIKIVVDKRIEQILASQQK